MRTVLLIVAVTALSAASTIAAEPEPESVTIPLDQIWGFDLPGTRDIAGIPLPEIDERRWGTDSSTLRQQREFDIEQFRRSLTAKAPADNAFPAFVVNRAPDFHCLRIASGLAAMFKQPQKLDPYRKTSFSVGSDTTLVMFSHPASYYLRLRRVKRLGNRIVVRYQYEPHFTSDTTVHFALIPLGKLAAGDYRVRFEQDRMDKRFEAAGFLPVIPSRVVSQQVNFTIWEPPVADKPDPNAQTIPLETVWADHIEGTRDVRKLEGQPSGDTIEEHIASSRINQLEQALRATNDPAKPGFVVPAVDAAALEQACDVIAKGAASTNVLPPHVEATLVFFANTWLPLHLDRIELDGHAIKIKYHFRHTQDRMSWPHFALIPLGKLPSGKYDVSMVQLPTEGEGGEVDPERVRRIVCQDFSFDVAQRLEKR